MQASEGCNCRCRYTAFSRSTAYISCAYLYTHTLSLSLTHSLSLSLTHTHSLSGSLSLKHRCTHTQHIYIEYIGRSLYSHVVDMYTWSAYTITCIHVVHKLSYVYM